MGSTFGPIFSKPFYGIRTDHMTLNFHMEEVILHWPNGYDSIYLFNSKSHTPKLQNNTRRKHEKFTFEKHQFSNVLIPFSMC